MDLNYGPFSLGSNKTTVERPDGSVSISFSGGDMCSQGTLRSVQINMRCAPEIVWAAIRLSEPQGCSYVIDVVTSGVCSALSAAKPLVSTSTHSQN